MNLLILLSSVLVFADVSMVQTAQLQALGTGTRSVVNMQGVELAEWMTTQPAAEPAVFDRDAILVETDSHGRQVVSMYPKGRDAQIFFASIRKRIVFQSALRHMTVECTKAKLRQVDAQGIWVFDAIVPSCDVVVSEGLSSERRAEFLPRSIEACQQL